MENARTVRADCKVENRSICRSVELTADILFLFLLLLTEGRSNDEKKRLFPGSPPAWLGTPNSEIGVRVHTSSTMGGVARHGRCRTLLVLVRAHAAQHVGRYHDLYHVDPSQPAGNIVQDVYSADQIHRICAAKTPQITRLPHRQHEPRVDRCRPGTYLPIKYVYP